MKPFLKEVPKEIDNIYLEYENLFGDCVHYSEYATFEDKIYKDSGLTWFEFFKEHKKIEIEFSEVIEKIILHLNEQYKKYTPYQLISFNRTQKRHFKTYLPKDRKQFVYDSFLVKNIANGEERILNNKLVLGEGEKEYFSHFYNQYENYYYKLEEDCNILIEEFRSSDNSQMQPFPTEAKDEMLKAKLGEYGFFELQMVKQLSEPNKQSLIELITSNEMPYGIAMFDYLGFLKHLKAKYLKIDSKLFKEISKWFEVVERTVSGNIYVLNKFSKEDRTRYTADQQKQRVQKDYEKLK
jgi:hypothetical protein